MLVQNRYKITITIVLFLIVIAALNWNGCTQLKEDPFSPNKQLSNAGTCVSCHTDYNALRRLYSPDTASSGGGCGGDIPHIEPYDRVYLGGEGFSAFRNSTHGNISCVTCHEGNDNLLDKKAAHGDNLVKQPSKNSDMYCKPCHSSIHDNFESSLHMQGWGQKSMVTLRAGYNSFDECPDKLKEGYNKNCAKCHANCGDCHVNRPIAGGGGLYKGHQFNKRPNMRDNCVACHTSRGGHAYFGIGSGTVPDIHLSKLGDGHCLNCHSKTELHGDGNVYDQRYKMPLLPKCEDCHKEIDKKNDYHSKHFTNMNCQTCHSQNYNNCGSCHIGGEGARIPSYLGFKIGMNPIKETRPYKFATLRRSLMAPDSWQNYGVPILKNFNVKPTFKYATPHNIQRWTKRTKVDSGKSCSYNCHIIKENNEFRNKELYLFKSDLLDWEVQADTGIVVDGKLPDWWGVQ